MPNISRLRAVITTDKSEASRLASGVAEAAMNDRTHGFMIHAAPFDRSNPKDKRHTWTLSVAPVSSIGSSGAAFGSAIAWLSLSPTDLDDLASGKARIALVRE